VLEGAGGQVAKFNTRSEEMSQTGTPTQIISTEEKDRHFFLSRRSKKQNPVAKTDSKHLNSQQMKTVSRRKEGAPIYYPPLLCLLTKPPQTTPIFSSLPFSAPSAMLARANEDNESKGGVLH